MVHIGEIADRSESPVQAILELLEYTRDNPQLLGDVNHVSTGSAVQWLLSWGRSPGTFMYQQSGGYANFLEYKYLMRRGVHVAEIPDALALRIRKAFLDYPIGAEYEHDTPRERYQEPEYE
jgi:hypothetical protein